MHTNIVHWYIYFLIYLFIWLFYIFILVKLKFCLRLKFGIWMNRWKWETSWMWWCYVCVCGHYCFLLFPVHQMKGCVGSVWKRTNWNPKTCWGRRVVNHHGLPLGIMLPKTSLEELEKLMLLHWRITWMLSTMVKYPLVLLLRLLLWFSILVALILGCHQLNVTSRWVLF